MVVVVEEEEVVVVVDAMVLVVMIVRVVIVVMVVMAVMVVVVAECDERDWRCCCYGTPGVNAIVCVKTIWDETWTLTEYGCCAVFGWLDASGK